MTDSPASTSAQQVIGEARCYVELVRLLETIRHSLGVPYSVLDSVAGLPGGYSQKTLQRTPHKHLGLTSLGSLLGAMGIKLIAVIDDEQRAKNAKRSDWRRSKPQGGWKHRGTGAIKPARGDQQNQSQVQFKGNSNWGREMRQRQMVLLTPDHRQRLAAKAGKASGRARLRSKLMRTAKVARSGHATRKA